MTTATKTPFKLALVCGGPSLERGISLNSARSVLDHLNSEEIEIIPFYLDYRKRPYEISQAQLYSNTPSDFDFKLQQTAKPLTDKQFIKRLKSLDIVFPVMHGPYGEDGAFQKFLERNKIPFVGSGSEACKKLFDKHNANNLIGENGFYTEPSAVLRIYKDDHARIINQFFKDHKVKRAIIKPATGGSSIYVFSVNSPKEALEKAQFIFSKRTDTRVVIEPFVHGIEFTVIILQNKFGLPVAIFPSQIETDYTENQIFDFRKKYLPTRAVSYHCPPRFDDTFVQSIQAQAEQLFALFGMNDFARFDGWIMPNGKIWFSDFNPISGMEQNSFLFQQASRIGLSHRQVLAYIVAQACRRHNVPFPEIKEKPTHKRKQLNILFGGSTAERQVSLMSGTNVWLKLRQSDDYDPQPYLLDPYHRVWKLGYQYALNHTVEEVMEGCMYAHSNSSRIQRMAGNLRLRLGTTELYETCKDEFGIPECTTLDAFLKESPRVFLGLHGGVGEDGTIQGTLDRLTKGYNGPSAELCQTFMDKLKTRDIIEKAAIKGISSAPKIELYNDTLARMRERDMRKLWTSITKELGQKKVIIKPADDGCSSGIVALHSHSELMTYISIQRSRLPVIPANTFKNQPEQVELSSVVPTRFLVEPFISTDLIRIKNNTLKHYPRSGFIEITVGVINDGKKIRVMNPSLSVAEGSVLTVEEKFQGGTGVNITPPPESIVSNKILRIVKERLLALCEKLELVGYSRIDAFLTIETGDLIIIEINSLPALTPSTVLYHQGLTESPSMTPKELLELIAKKCD